MGNHVIQCLDCGAWNWAYKTTCNKCGSANLTASFSQVCGHYKKKEGK